jgi:hypothetical protein
MLKKLKILKALRVELESGAQLLVSERRAGVKSPQTVQAWRKKSPRIDRYITACINRCENKRVVIVEDALAKAAQEGNTTAMIFFLTNRCPERWADRRAIVNNTNNNIVKVTVNPVKQFKDEELDGIISNAFKR